ncbi:MAG TPA: hypothetical protein VJ763_06355 [Sphingomicrobium sp.]|jgi:hypothetical protein|nr:hypothetical protein [Sphingomicrobium sp.]
MTETSEAGTKRRSRLRWVTLGEAIAIAALILSGLGLWHELNKKADPPKVIVEKPDAIPLALRGRVTDDGRELQISPIEDSHALQSLTVTAAGTKIEVGNDGELSANAIEKALGKTEGRDGTHRVTVRIAARYVEAGADKTATGSYSLTYRWEGGGLFGGRSLRFVGLSR